MKITDKMSLDWILTYLSNDWYWNRSWKREDIDFAIQCGVSAHGSYDAAIRAEAKRRRKP